MDLDAIFKAYDVRGVVPDQLDESAARRIGHAFARFAGSRRIAVGRDVRLSSPILASALIDGVHAAGVAVDDLGLITTDMVYFAAGHLDQPGAMVTASHNPKGHNGIKMCLAGAAPVGVDSGLAEVRALASDEPPPRSGGETVPVSLLDAYVDHLIRVSGAESAGPLRVAVDGGNGVAGIAIPALFDRLEAQLLGLYLEPDGTFPNHHPDPLRPENLVDLAGLMSKEAPDFGVAFDGDADRAFFVDDSGVPLPGSTITALVADWYLSAQPGATIVHNLICSRAVPEAIEAAGGVPVRTRVGHSFIKAVMRETGAIFGGEHSGHYYYRDNYGADSGLLTMLVLMRIVAEAGAPLSVLRRRFETYVQSGEVNLSVADPEIEIERVEQAFLGGDRLDGLTVDLGDKWFNLRPSNTEAVLRLNVEASDRRSLDELVGRVRSQIEEVSDAGSR